MKKKLIIILSAIPMLGFAQSGTYMIKGKLASYHAGTKIFLYHSAAGQSSTDSATLVDGNYIFSGNVKEPVRARLVLKNYSKLSPGAENELPVYLVPGTTVLNSADSLSSSKVSGAKLNVEYFDYQAKQAVIDNKYEALDQETAAATEAQQNAEQFKKQQEAKEKVIDAENLKFTREFIQLHPASLVSLVALDAYSYKADYTELQPLFDGLTTDVRNNTRGQQFASKLSKLKTVALGAIAPDFVLPDTSGKMVRLSDMRGRYVLIDLWASWCPPCRAENPNVVKVFNQYKDKGFTVVGVSLDSGTPVNWMKAIHSDHLNWTQLSDLKGYKNAVAQLYGVNAIPQNFLIDPNGKIIAKTLRGTDLEKKLVEIFNMQVPASAKENK